VDSKKKEINTLLQRVVKVKIEAKRLKLIEAVHLLEMSELSIFLEFSGFTIEAVENNPNLTGYSRLKNLCPSN